jgi:hypothetical protein
MLTVGRYGRHEDCQEPVVIAAMNCLAKWGAVHWLDLLGICQTSLLTEPVAEAASMSLRNPFPWNSG